jgi:hypothetical protein
MGGDERVSLVMKTKYILVLCISLALINSSCKKKNEIGASKPTYDYDLVESNVKQSFFIDTNVDYFIPALFPFDSKDGQSYLSFQNRGQSEILFYRMNEPDCVFRLKINMEGPDGIPRFLGYYIKDFDEIYLTNPGIPHIIRTDTSGKIRQKINYGTTDEGKMLVPSFMSMASTTYTPLVIIENKFFFTQTIMPGEPIETWPVSGYVDTATLSVKDLPFYFPPIINSDEIYTTGIGPELDFSRCFNGSEFIYSFFFEESVVVTSPDHTQIRRIPAKSKYIDRINDPHEKRPADPIRGARRVCEAAFYGSLLYDSYRDVYYRIAYPETEMEANQDYIELWQTGRKRFSIMILDHDFNIIGETLFPDYLYKSHELFVGKEGLYICDSHVKNPGFDEDVLSFRCFELRKK